MSLATYKKKRNFKDTSEPLGKVKFSKKGLVFVVQKHAATHLHYDFRLEINGVLKSWVLPKGPSLNSKDKRLAIMVEDHPYDYRNFEGTISKGNYGAGTVMVWDTGQYYPLDDNYQFGTEKELIEGLNKGKISFFLKGKKLNGIFNLIKLKSSEDNHWLLLKYKDNYDSKENVLDEENSVITNRTMNQITIGTNKLSNLKNNKNISKKEKSQEKEDMPKNIEPMLAHLAETSFDSQDWLFEIKWDGFRAISEIRGEEVKLYSRNFKSFNERFPIIVEALQKLNIQAIFDGEIVILTKEGKSDFQALQNYQTEMEERLRYIIFDLLYYDGVDLRTHKLLERKQILKKILADHEDSILLFGDHILNQGKRLLSEAKKENIEGIIAKKIQSPYQSTRSRDWLKIKTHQRQEAVICGFTSAQGSRQQFGALILGVYEKDKLTYVGRVGGGFNRESLSRVMEHLKPLITQKSPFEVIPKINVPVFWVKPKLMCEVSFAEWTKEGYMRQPIFMGLRFDKKSKEVKHEEALPLPKIEKKNKSEKLTSSKAIDSKITNLDKIYWPKEKYTKGDIIKYYYEIASYILPYLKDRPEILRRYPNGIEGKAFFQKNFIDKVPEWISTFKVKHSHGENEYLLISDIPSLIFAVNLGCIDLNPFNSSIQHLNNPDYLVLDLDPEEIKFDAVIETAQVFHEIAKSYDIPSYCKTSGATGLHIYVPLKAKYPYQEVKQFALILAEMVHKHLPKVTSLERTPSKRQGRVYLDYLQNNFGQSMAAPYCVRPRPGAPVSTPLEWSEVKKGLDPLSFNMKNIFDRLKKKGDLFAPVLSKGIDFLQCLNKMR